MRTRAPSGLGGLVEVLQLKRGVDSRPPKRGAVVPQGRAVVDDFYEVFAVNMRRLATPVYPNGSSGHAGGLSETSSIARSIPSQAGRGCFLIGFKEMLEIQWASSLRSQNRFSPT